MANIKSAKKRINTINRQNTENKLVKSTMATCIKKFKALLKANDIEKAELQLKETISYIDTAVSKGIIHKNNRSRKISRLTSAFDAAKKKASVKVEEKKVEALPVVEKKPAIIEANKETDKKVAKKATKTTKAVDKKEKSVKKTDKKTK